MKRPISFLFLLLLALPGFSPGCGYSARSALPGNLRTIHVEAVKNSINYTDENRRNVYFPLMEVNVRNAIVDRVLFDGNMRIADAGKAALVIKSELVSYERQPIRHDENENVEEYRIQIIINFAVIDVNKDVPFLKEDGFVGEATYLTTGPNARSETTALNDAMVDLGRRVVARIVENW